MKRSLVVLILSLFCWSCVTPGTGYIPSVSTSAPSGGSPTAAAPASTGSTAPKTYKNVARKYEYTIPAGWELINGDPGSDSVGFKKVGASWGFLIHIEQMVPSFPRDAAVKAGLKSDQERIQIKKILEARRRDDGSAKKGGCGVIGWELTEAPQDNSFQRIIWQAYDGENFYMNFNAYSANEDFQAAKATLRQIMDSIKFCK
jgi:hypothetical protein